jgi:hypothetical protein
MKLPGKLALDGCPFVVNTTIWFCSAREGYTGIHFFTAKHSDNETSELRIADDQFKSGYEVGEFHITTDGKELYFHSQRPGGQGEFDIWVTRNEHSVWQEPENIAIINSPETDGWLYISQDHNELWFTKTYEGSPAVYQSL